jgi:hypothetical protein
VAKLAGLLPQCRDTHDAKRLPKLLELLQIKPSLWSVRASFADQPCAPGADDTFKISVKKFSDKAAAK